MDVRAERYGAIVEAQKALERLRDLVCPLCAKGDPLFCEVVDGVHTHVNGDCSASPIRELRTHVDDIRDQYANEFNPEEKPRAKWTYSMVPEGDPDA